MTFQKKVVVRLKGGMPADDLDIDLIPREFVNENNKWRISTSALQLGSLERNRLDLNFCAFLSKYLHANFTPQNLPAAKKILDNENDLLCDCIKVTNFSFEGENIPTVDVEAKFTINFKNNLSQSELHKWESKQDDPLAWCVNFWWIFDNGSDEEWEGFLDTNDGVDLLISEN